MNLSDRTDVGMLDVVANDAHELGHAWGLLHEHQNPAFWTSLIALQDSEVDSISTAAI